MRTIQSQADESGLGISIVAVRLGRVAPPAAVAPAFADAARARSDRRQAVTRAEEYRDRTRSEARGQAREIADAAAGRVDRLVRPLAVRPNDSPACWPRHARLPTRSAAACSWRPSPTSLPRFRRKVIVAPGQAIDLGLIEDGTRTEGGPR